MGSAIDLTGKIFGRLKVVRRAARVPNDKCMEIKWDCECNCSPGVIVTVRSYCLRTGETRSCGCLCRERTSKARTIHGHTANAIGCSPEFKSWIAMKGRCHNPRDAAYSDYGARGIKVCDRWMNSFDNFFADMGPRPSLKHSVDRYPNNNGNYEPGNCRWATWTQQARNRRGNVAYTIDGVTKLLPEWCEQFKIPHSRVYNRIKYLHWPILKALTAPCRRREIA